MNSKFELARIENFGNVFRTPCGIVNINVRGVTLHLTEDAFMDFSSMIDKACSKYMNQKLADLIQENDN